MNQPVPPSGEPLPWVLIRPEPGSGRGEGGGPGPAQTHERRLAFGDFVLDRERKELRRGSSVVVLRPQTFDVLELLVCNANRLVTKEELLREVWHGAHVTGDSLVQCVRELRQALGDSAQELIRTLPRRGYLLSADVGPAVAQQGGGSSPPAPALPAAQASVAGGAVVRRRVRRRAFIVAALVVLLGAAGSAAWLARQPGARGDLTALAVLPFVSLGPASESDEVLGVGMADALILRLSGISRLVVRPTSAVIGVRAKVMNGQEVGRKLEVAYVLEGRLQRLGQRMRVTAQLVSVSDGSTRWEDRFEIEETDLFRMQDEIAERAARSLLQRLSPGDRKLLARRDTISAEARTAYETGRYLWARRPQSALRASIAQFERAIALDPSYALPHAGEADAFNLLGEHAADPRASFQRAREAAQRALALDENLADAHAALAFARAHLDHDWAAADEGYRRALALAPGEASAMEWLAQAYAAHGRFPEAIDWARRARAADPVSLMTNLDLARSLYFARQYDEAIAQLRTTLELDPSFVPAHVELGRVYRQKGMAEEAVAELTRALALSERSADVMAELASARAAAGDRTGARELLGNMQSRAHCDYVSPYHLAVVHAALGETEQAVRHLEEANEERFSSTVFANVEPDFDRLRASPRFPDLVRRLGLAAQK